ncbi:hypothetical protein DIPPA_64583 [Diplonema papillatum]|nr:hypothetical protein DIPPA_64583 [Diplonema papillatum]
MLLDVFIARLGWHRVFVVCSVATAFYADRVAGVRMLHVQHSSVGLQLGRHWAIVPRRSIVQHCVPSSQQPGARMQLLPLAMTLEHGAITSTQGNPSFTGSHSSRHWA